MTDQKASELAEAEDNALYDDWSYYLNNFVTEKGCEPCVFLKIDTLSFKSSIFKELKPKSEFSLLFLKKDKPALYAADPIVEPYVYKYIDAYFQNKEKVTTIKDIIGVDIDPKKNDISNVPKWLGLAEIELNFK